MGPEPFGEPMSDEETRQEATRLIQSLGKPERAATDRLLALVYDQLRKIAQQRLRAERTGATLQPTALVHEAYLRLIGDENVHWEGRGHFFAAAAEAMRRILVEQARRKAGPKRGGHLRRVQLDEIDDPGIQRDDRLVRLDEALAELEKHDAEAAALVKLRYFAGLGHQEAAEVLGIGRRAADRRWALARAWLFEQIENG
jgi:RNA polymerase sigma factor (TIGR02999 family)